MAGKAKKALKAIIFPVLYRLYNFHMRSERIVKIDKLKLSVTNKVFHPGFFFSSGFLKEELAQLDLANKTLLDIGSGSGILSIYAASKTARVTAIDIAEAAVETTRKNAALNEVNLEVIRTDLWENLAPKAFDYIVVNPPYYPDAPQREEQFAWFCGPNFEYFSRFYQGLKDYMHPNTLVLMILSEDCQLDHIKEIAGRFDFEMAPYSTRKNFWEENYIFEIKPQVK